MEWPFLPSLPISRLQNRRQPKVQNCKAFKRPQFPVRDPLLSTNALAIPFGRILLGASHLFRFYFLLYPKFAAAVVYLGKLAKG